MSDHLGHIHARICQLILAIAQDWDEEEQIEADTLLIADLGFASIDFVQLVVDIEAAFKQKLGFQELLMPDGKYVDDLSVLALTQFVEQRFKSTKSSQTVAVKPGQTRPITALPASERLHEDKVRKFLSLVPHRPPQPIDHKNPPMIFILSPPRCGSTLLRVILAGHPGLFAPPELHLLMYDTLAQRKRSLARPATDYLLEGTVRALMQIRQCSAEDARELMNEYEDQQLTTKDFYYELQQQLDDRRLLDKTPSYALSPDVLNRAEAYFEDSLFIHLIRHPYGAIRSYEDAKLERLTLPFIDDLDNQEPFSRREFAELMWTVSQQNIVEFISKVPPHRVRQVKFEEMVNNPQTTLIELCRFLQIEFLPSMLSLYDDGAQRMTDGVQTVSRMGGDLKFFLHKGIDADAANNWMKYHTVDFLGERSWQLAERFGYKRGLAV